MRHISLWSGRRGEAYVSRRGGLPKFSPKRTTSVARPVTKGRLNPTSQTRKIGMYRTSGRDTRATSTRPVAWVHVARERCSLVQAPDLPAVIGEGPDGLVRSDFHDAPDDDFVVAAIMDRVDFTVEPGDGAGQDG